MADAQTGAANQEDGGKNPKRVEAGKRLAEANKARQQQQQPQAIKSAGGRGGRQGFSGNLLEQVNQAWFDHTTRLTAIYQNQMGNGST